ncbi:MAG: phage tail protein [Coprobacillus sp.]
MRGFAHNKMSFHVMIDAKEVGRFVEVTMADTVVEEIEYRSEIYHKRKAPDFIKHSNITLKEGIVTEELMTWIKASMVGNCELKTVVIELYDDMDKVAHKWKIKDVSPVKYSVSEPSSINSEVLIDYVELANGGVMAIEG